MGEAWGPDGERKDDNNNALVLASVRHSRGTVVSAKSAAPNAIGERGKIFRGSDSYS
jgi:hypothetical protein